MDASIGVGRVEPDVVIHVFAFEHSTEDLALALGTIDVLQPDLSVLFVEVDFYSAWAYLQEMTVFGFSRDDFIRINFGTV